MSKNGDRVVVSVSYRYVRSWDGDQGAFQHPDGLPARAWRFADGRLVMLHVLRTIAFPRWPEEPSFHIAFESLLDPDTFLCYRQFIITTPTGTVTLQPLLVSYEAAFGMLSVFVADVVSGRSATAEPARSAPPPVERV